MAAQPTDLATRTAETSFNDDDFRAVFSAKRIKLALSDGAQELQDQGRNLAVLSALDVHTGRQVAKAVEVIKALVPVVEEVSREMEDTENSRKREVYDELRARIRHFSSELEGAKHDSERARAEERRYHHFILRIFNLSVDEALKIVSKRARLPNKELLHQEDIAQLAEHILPELGNVDIYCIRHSIVNKKATIVKFKCALVRKIFAEQRHGKMLDVHLPQWCYFT